MLPTASAPARTAALAVASFVALGMATTAPASATDEIPKDRAGLEAFVRDYLMENPQVIRDALFKLEEDEQLANTKRVLREHKDELYAAGSPEIGNPDATVTIVEFFDYNCPYCRATYAKMKEFLKTNPDTKVVLKDVASLGEHSEAVARLVIAAAKQKRDFPALHDALMTAKGQMTEPRALSIAQQLGYDIEEMKKVAATNETAATLTRTQDLATALNVNVTPLYVVGHNGVAGAPEDLLPQITELADGIRKSGCDVC